MKLDIMTEANKQLQTIEIFFNNALETKIETHKEGKKISTTTTTRTIEEMPNVLVIQYDRFNNTTKKVQEDVKCELNVNFNNTPYKLMGVIVHKGDNLDNGNYIGIFNLPITKKYNNVFHIQDKPNADLINQAYLLLFERSAPVSPSSPIITLPSQEISQDDPEQITISQPATCNLQSLTVTQLQVKQTKIKLQVIKFMYNEKGSFKSQHNTK